MTLILFDIDGTLVMADETDGACYAEAFQYTFGLTIPTVDWSEYRHVTDWGIMDQALGGLRRTCSTQAERRHFEQAYFEAWERAYAKSPDACRPIPGAAAIFEEVAARDDCVLALATGNSRAPGMFKLQCAGIDAQSVPGGFSNDAISRTLIIRTAIRRAMAPGNAVVYIGDGLWDVRTCAALRIPFVGVDAVSDGEPLRNAGARTILRDFADAAQFWEAIASAKIPSTTPPTPKPTSIA